MLIEYTHYGLEKTEKFTHLNTEGAKKLIRRASVRGTNVLDLPARKREYFEKKVDLNNRVAMIYSGFCFIYANNYCVNMYRVPPYFNRKSSYNGKTQVRDPKKYSKHYDMEGVWDYA